MARIDTQKLGVPNKIFSSWQDLLELFSQLSHTPVAMITRLHQNKLEVYCANHGIHNPYRIGAVFELGSHHFCETTIKNDAILVVKDAAKDENWQKTSAVTKEHIAAYLGIPLHWPNGTPFGSLAILDTKENEFEIYIRELLAVFKDTIEAQLTVIYQNQKLHQNNQDLQSRIHTRTIELASLSYQLDQETIKRRKLEREFHYQQYHDLGSGLLNARAWELETNRLVNQSDLYQQEVTVFYLGISNGARIQADMGTETLDIIIKNIKEALGTLSDAKQLVARPRQNDIAYTLLHKKELNATQDIIQRLLEITSQDFSIPSGKVRLQVYIGVATSDPNCGQQNLGLTVQAYQAMQIAQESGKRVLFYDLSTHAGAPKLNQLESYFMASIRDKALHVFFQPQVALTNGHWSSASTSIRWDHPVLGRVSELSISQLCDQPKLADALCQFIIHKAAEVCAKWRTFSPNFRIAVPLNSCQLALNNFPLLVQRWLDEAALPGSALEIEISERRFFSNEAALQPNLDKLEKMGVLLTLSDFGHGHASFSYLKHSPFKRLKIDKSFTRNLLHSAEDRSFLHSLMQITEKLGLDTVLTGVETKAQEQWLMQFQTPFAEGIKYNGPMSRNDFEQALSKQVRSTSV